MYAPYHKRGIELTKRMLSDERVVRAEVQEEKKRFKRDYLLPFFEPKSRERRLQSDLSVYKRPPVPVYDRTFNDELWVQEWYMVSFQIIQIRPPVYVDNCNSVYSQLQLQLNLEYFRFFSVTISLFDHVS